MLHQAIVVSAAFSMFLAAGPVLAQDKAAPVTCAPGKTLPSDPKAGVWDDGLKPVAPNSNTKGGTWDDGLKPVAPKAANPAANPKGGVWDDGHKPVAPKP